MEEYLIIELTLCSISIVLLVKIMILYLCYPALFLKHPNQIHFYALIFWILSECLTLVRDILTHKY